MGARLARARTADELSWCGSPGQGTTRHNPICTLSVFYLVGRATDLDGSTLPCPGQRRGTSTTKTIAAAVVAVTAVAALSACSVDTSTTGGSKHHSGGARDNSSGAKSGKDAPSYSTAQENAIRSAQSYLDLGSGFSKAGLIQQLTWKAGEGFKMADAVFAVNHIKVDYNEQAVLSAKAYLDMSGFSRSGLIQQLTSKAGDQYTMAQATYAAKKVGL